MTMKLVDGPAPWIRMESQAYGANSENVKIKFFENGDEEAPEVTHLD